MNELPLYLQIADYLRRELAGGRYRVGQKLPTEAAFGRELCVAVGTLRKSLLALETEGLLERRQGSGTYVKALPEAGKYPLFHLELNGGGGEPSGEILGLNLAPTTQLSPAQHIRRRRRLDDTWVAVEDIWVRTPDTLQLDWITPALYQMYRERLQLWVARVEDKVGLAPVPAHVGEYIEPAHAAYVERFGLDHEGQLIEYSQTWFDSQVCHYNARWS
ncbi:GntR family transcriptional regulator [Litorivicinus lipolyticus]|uniref:GntR family transcriptional regulator n=1 Tax=Litorivicinus lipolyticus TaxID=418701 RepID=A0A5Q2QAK5_9GAMM|nr:GntR family transcriptional regulator [Litorivicinus lipolyticus]QGG79262.1 GntR family transcriptional regulator [Litorivicinus lipolyticus]